ncbi:MAG: OmpA family protein [Opitutaceae bacterium]|nr:OmpA family protein [Cytophagales bacterium]
MNKLLLITSLLISQVTLAQDVQWAFKVLEYSSQKDIKAFSSKQVIGKPNVFPATGESVNAWQYNDAKERDQEFIKVGFFVPIKPKKVYIGESYNPGYISKVFVYDASGKEHEIASNTPGPISEKGRLFSINTSNIDFFVFAIKVVLKPTKGTPVGIDAIGISESDKPYEIKLNHADVIKSNMVVKKLERTVNSRFPEHGPLLSPDGQMLYFSRSFHPKNFGGAEDYEDIWTSAWDNKNQKWEESKNMGIPFNNEEPNFINSISPDGNTLLLGNAYSEKGTVAGGASISYKTAKGWSNPKRLVIEDDHNINEKSNYYMSNSQKALMMSIERKKDSYGDRDIYVSFIKQDSSWSKPLNLGPIVNSVGTECAPFLASDEKTLYYASNGLEGYGGTDIYVTRRLDETWKKWSQPENLGPIVNTANNESYFTMNAEGDKVFYTSIGDSINDIDIYTLTLPEIVKPLPVVMVKGRVLDSKNGNPLPGVKIIFEDLITGKEMGIAKSNPETSEYEIMLPSGNDYGFLAVKAGYISVNSNMDLRNLKEFEEMKKDLFLTPIESGMTVVLNNVFFDFKSTTLLKESHQELDRLITMLKNNKSTKVEISGHTDNIGSDAYNDFISFQRAKAVSAYLTANTSITPDRISVQYHGEGKPVADNSTLKGRKLNRRVEFKILSQ